MRKNNQKKCYYSSFKINPPFVIQAMQKANKSPISFIIVHHPLKNETLQVITCHISKNSITNAQVLYITFLLLLFSVTESKSCVLVKRNQQLKERRIKNIAAQTQWI